VAVDFVSPESVAECRTLARQLRGCGYENEHWTLILQS